MRLDWQVRRDFELHARVTGGLEGFRKLGNEFRAEGVTALEAEGLRAGQGNKGGGGYDCADGFHVCCLFVGYFMSVLFVVDIVVFLLCLLC